MATRAEHAAAARREVNRIQAVAQTLATGHGGVVTRRMLIQAGMAKGQIRTQIDRGVWTPIGRHTLSVKGGAPSDEGLLWRALWESGAGAVLDGPSALLAAGLRHWTEAVVHVSVPNKSEIRRVDGVRHHRLRDLGPVMGSQPRRTRPELAVIRAAQWAATDKQAATLVAMTVQQGLAAPSAILEQWSQVTYSPRRGLLSEVIADVCNGAQSLGELDFARLCRRWGLPPPSRQVVRKGERGRIYLDVFWDDWAVHVEIQGAQHYVALAPVDDALRFNHLGLHQRDLVSLQIPVIGLRTHPEAFMNQVERALQSQGWHRAA